MNIVNSRKSNKMNKVKIANEISINIKSKFGINSNHHKSNKPLRCRSLILLVICVFIVLILTLNASAIGVSPGRTTLNFEPGLVKNIGLTVINAEKKAMTVVFYVRGELKEYVKLSQQSAVFAEGEEIKSLTYTVNLPDSMDKPGVHKTEIVVLEVSKESKIKTETGEEVIVLDSPSVGARLAVISQLYVYVLHPGKYLEAGLDTIIGDDGKARFLIPVTSQGKLGIGSAKATIDIYTSLNEKVATIETNSLSIESQERKELFAEWDYGSAGINPGKYRGVATITYDGQTAYADKEFEVGVKSLDIESIEVNNFRLGEIAKFSILVNNRWASPLKEVSVQISVYNEKGEVMADFASQNYEIPALSKAEVVSYWDTVGVKEGKYRGKLAVRYEDKFIERTIEIIVSSDDIEVTGFTGKAVFPKKSFFSLQNILIGIVVLLILINAAWFFMFLRKKRKKESV